MEEEDSVTIARAQVLLGGNGPPYSESTVRRMIRDDVLRSYGVGTLRRVSVADIMAYKRGEREWVRSARQSAGRAAAAQSSGSGMGRTSPAQPTGRAVVAFPLDRTATARQRKR